MATGDHTEAALKYKLSIKDLMKHLPEQSESYHSNANLALAQTEATEKVQQELGKHVKDLQACCETLKGTHQLTDHPLEAENNSLAALLETSKGKLLEGEKKISYLDGQVDTLKWLLLENGDSANKVQSNFVPDDSERNLKEDTERPPSVSQIFSPSLEEIMNGKVFIAKENLHPSVNCSSSYENNDDGNLEGKTKNKRKFDGAFEQSSCTQSDTEDTEPSTLPKVVLDVKIPEMKDEYSEQSKAEAKSHSEMTLARSNNLSASVGSEDWTCVE